MNPISFLTKLNFSIPISPAFRLPDTYSETLRTITKTVSPLLNAHPTSRALLSGFFIVIHVRDLLRRCSAQGETLDTNEKKEIALSILKIISLSASFFCPYGYLISSSLLELVIALKETAQENRSTTDFSFSMLNAAQKACAFLSLACESPTFDQKQEKPLAVWSVLSSFLRIIQELRHTLSTPNHSEKLSSIAMSLLMLAQSTLLSVEILSQARKNPQEFLCSLQVLTSLFMVSTFDMIRLGGGAFLEKLTMVSAMVSGYAFTCGDLPDALFNVVRRISSFLSNTPIVSPVSQPTLCIPIAIRDPQLSPSLENMSGWHAQKQQVAPYLQRIKKPDQHRTTTLTNRFLFWGETGTGKSSFARAFSVSAEKPLTTLCGSLKLEDMQRAIREAPQGGIVLIEDIQSWGSPNEEDEEKTSAFYSTILDARPDLVFLGTTRKDPSHFDLAFIGRFLPISFLPPNLDERRELLTTLCQRVEWENPPLEDLSTRSNGFSYRELSEAMNLTALHEQKTAELFATFLSQRTKPPAATRTKRKRPISVRLHRHPIHHKKPLSPKVSVQDP